MSYRVKTTAKDVTLVFREYGEITVPKGVLLTNRTALGIDINYHFVDQYDWIETNYKDINRVLRHDAVYYGIDIPIEHVDFELTDTEIRVLQSIHLRGCTGSMGSLNKSQRLALLKELVRMGYLDEQAQVTKKGIEKTAPKF